MKLKANKNNEEVVDTVDTTGESEVETSEKEIGVASTEKLQRANELLAKLFNVDSTFYMTGAKDTGKSLTLEFANIDFEVKIKIKDVYEMGIMNDTDEGSEE